jgi:hypothetical protein
VYSFFIFPFCLLGALGAKDLFSELDSKLNVTDGTITMINCYETEASRAYCYRVGKIAFLTFNIKTNVAITSRAQYLLNCSIHPRTVVRYRYSLPAKPSENIQLQLDTDGNFAIDGFSGTIATDTWLSDYMVFITN